MLLKSTGSLAEVLEIHGFTGTRGTRPNAAPGGVRLIFHKENSYGKFQ